MGSDRSHVRSNRGGELRNIYQFVGLNTRHPPGAQHQGEGQHLVPKYAIEEPAP